MLSFMRKKRSSYDLAITQDITQEGAEVPSTNKRSSFKYYGLNNPESRVNPEETNELVEKAPSNEHSPSINRQKLSDVNESDIKSFNEKATFQENEKDEAPEKDETSEEKDEKSEETPIQGQNGQSPEGLSQIFKKCDSIKRKGSEKTDSGDVILRENGADTKTKARSRPSLLEEVLAETSRLSISSQNRDVHADKDDDDDENGEVFTEK